MNDITNFCCPVCKNPLQRQNQSYLCLKRHTFDLAREGYLNLVLAHQKKSKEPGDSREMILARKNFLNLGCYAPLVKALAEIITRHCQLTASGSYQLCDAGCGEGYYLQSLSSLLPDGQNFCLCGVDVSKEGVREAAKRGDNVDLAVASVYDLPLPAEVLDCLISIFAPTPSLEFARVLKDDGILITVRPGAGHLLELKKELYAEAYLNTEDKLDLPDFTVAERHKVDYRFTVEGADNLLNLIRMTPYYHNTAQESIALLLAKASGMDIRAEFIITVYKKKLLAADE